MTELSKVLLEEQPVKVTVSSESPKITITDEDTQQVTVLQSDPVSVTLAKEEPKIIINPGFASSYYYNWSTEDVNSFLSVIEGDIDIRHLHPDIVVDLGRLEDLWARIGNELILTYPDGVSIQDAGREYTDNSITDAVIDLRVEINGEIDARYSIIEQTADSIDQRVTAFQQDANGIFETHNSRILQTEQSIVSTVSRLNSIDGAGGDLELLWSSINQTAESLTLEVNAREITDGAVTELGSQIALVEDSISLTVDSLSTLTDRLDSTEIALDTSSIELEAATQSLSNLSYSLSTLQTITYNGWGVSIEEDVHGNTYASGFQLLTHPIWLLDKAYVVGNTVDYQESIYECIADHTADSINSPDGVDGGTYWTQLPGSTKSEFSISAEHFKIHTPTGSEPLFSLDSTTGQAVLNNVALIIGNGTTGYENIIDRPLSIQEINQEEFALLESSSATLVYSWTGSELMSTETDIAGADEWIFDSEYSGGAIVVLEFEEESFEGVLEAALNEEHLTLQEWDSGSVLDETEAVVDLTKPGNPVDLGGLF